MDITLESNSLTSVHFTLINEWFITVETGREAASYGYLVDLRTQDLTKSNQLRAKIGLRTVKTHNGLIDIQENTGIRFYLWPRESSKIELVN